MRIANQDWFVVVVAAIAIAVANAVIALTVLPLVMSIDFGGQFTWYAARAAGMLAFLLATGSVLLGIATSTKVGGRLLGKGNVADVHRVLSLLTLLAIGGHVLCLGLDQYSSFSLTELFVPVVTWYEPFWTGLGIIAAYMAVAVYISFYIRPLIGYKAWRAFHYAAFGVFALGALHGLFAGTDSGSTWALAIYGGSTLAVALMLAYRITLSRRESATLARMPAGEAPAPPLTGVGSFGS